MPNRYRADNLSRLGCVALESFAQHLFAMVNDKSNLYKVYLFVYKLFSLRHRHYNNRKYLRTILLSVNSAIENYDNDFIKNQQEAKQYLHNLQ